MASSFYMTTPFVDSPKTLTEGRDHSLSNAHYAVAILYTECLALLTYLQHDADIESALAVFHQTSERLAAHNLRSLPANELNHQSCAQLLFYHISHAKLFKPALARTELEASIALFPNNTIILSAYASNEARFRIDDRVRNIMRNVVLRERSNKVVGWFFAIWHEMKRGEVGGSTSHSVRATFERAVESQPHSPALWRAYTLYELSMNEAKRAKKVFLRGLTKLPWCKAYMMLAFSRLRDAMSFDELRKVYNAMVEKELRIHVDIQEVLERIEERRKEEARAPLMLPEDPESDDEYR